MTANHTSVPDPISLTTERLILRPWTGADFVRYAAMNADPRVMEHYPPTLNGTRATPALCA